MASIINPPKQTAYLLPLRQIGPLFATITATEVITDELEITQHPVQNGAAVTDHSYLKPATVQISVMFDATLQPLTTTYAQLLKLQSDRIPINVITGKRAFDNMLIKSLAVTTDAQTENSLAVDLDLQQILMVNSLTVAASRGTTKKPTAAKVSKANQKTPKKTDTTAAAGTKKPLTPEKPDLFQRSADSFKREGFN
jgi:hypothetical protein